MDEPAAEFELHDGTRVRVRAVEPSDKRLFQEAVRTASAETLRLRFGAARTLSSRDLDYLTNVDGVDHYAIGAVERDVTGHEKPAGVARYVRLPDDPDVAEVAVAVADRYQGKGLGSHLLHRAIDAARANGIRRLEFHVLPENTRAHHLLADLELRLEERRDGNLRVYTLEVPSSDVSGASDS